MQQQEAPLWLWGISSPRPPSQTGGARFGQCRGGAPGWSTATSREKLQFSWKCKKILYLYLFPLKSKYLKQNFKCKFHFFCRRVTNVGRSVRRQSRKMLLRGLPKWAGSTFRTKVITTRTPWWWTSRTWSPLSPKKSPANAQFSTTGSVSFSPSRHSISICFFTLVYRTHQRRNPPTPSPLLQLPAPSTAAGFKMCQTRLRNFSLIKSVSTKPQKYIADLCFLHIAPDRLKIISQTFDF